MYIYILVYIYIYTYYVQIPGFIFEQGRGVLCFGTGCCTSTGRRERCCEMARQGNKPARFLHASGRCLSQGWSTYTKARRKRRPPKNGAFPSCLQPAKGVLQRHKDLKPLPIQAREPPPSSTRGSDWATASASRKPK